MEGDVVHMWAAAVAAEMVPNTPDIWQADMHDDIVTVPEISPRVVYTLS
jgi:hypothetical protein